MLIKRGRFGEFLACSRYPDCKTTSPISLGVDCPKPGAAAILTEKRSRRGKVFFGCSNYSKTECDFVSWDRPLPQPCPKCGAKFVVQKVSKAGDAHPLPQRRVRLHRRPEANERPRRGGGRRADRRRPRRRPAPRTSRSRAKRASGYCRRAPELRPRAPASRRPRRGASAGTCRTAARAGSCSRRRASAAMSRACVSGLHDT